MSKSKPILSSIMKLTKKFLFFFSLAYYALVGLFMFMLFVLDQEVKGVFTIIWVVVIALLGLFIIFGYSRLIILKIIEKKLTEGILKE